MEFRTAQRQASQWGYTNGEMADHLEDNIARMERDVREGYADRNMMAVDSLREYARERVRRAVSNLRQAREWLQLLTE